MKHKANILLLGFTSHKGIESIKNISISQCSSMQETTEKVMANNFDLIISKYQFDNATALELNQSLEALKLYYTGSSEKKFRLLIITSSADQEDICKKNKLLYFPVEMNLRSLVLQLIDLPREPKRTNKNLAIINFKELFVRVDNNRNFIKEVIEKFFEIKDSRISDIRTPLLNSDLKKAKDAAHKLKGVLANFSMIQARTTIIELEQLIQKSDIDSAEEKLNELEEKINIAHEYYHENQDQFKK